MNLDNVLENIKKLDTLTLFSNPADIITLDKNFRSLLLMVHPDKNSEQQDLANEITIQLKQKRDEAKNLILNPTKHKTEVEIEIGKKKVIFSNVIHDGEISLILKNKNRILRILKDANFRDLFENGRKNWVKIKDHDHFCQYLYQNLQLVPINLNGQNTIGHLYPYIEGYSLVQIHEIFGGNLNIKHACWMVNRVVEILCWSHHNKISHLAVLPQHVIIYPDSHRGALIDWSFSSDSIPKAIPGGQKYDHEIFKKPKDCRFIDVKMAFRLINYLSNEKPPEPLTQFLEKVENNKFKTTKTLDVCSNYRQALDKCWKRKFLPLKINE